MDLSIDRWNKLTAAERRSAAKQLAKDLPAGFAFKTLRTFEFGGQKNHIALFILAGAEFALIPGGSFRIGFHPDRWEPNLDELESWQGTAEEYGIKKSIHEHVAAATLRPRQIKVGTLLVETAAGEVGWEPVDPGDAEVREILREYRIENQVTVCRGDVSTRVRRTDAGSVVAERSLARTYGQLGKELRSAGFRFPSSDEWEYLCGAGAPTLFRWGDHVPCDRYPTDVSPAEAKWRKKWVLSHGKLKYPPGGFKPDWNLHHLPNALGLLIAFDPYKCELVAEAGTTRGGDGGCTICGGAGFFAGWLTLATAYLEKETCKHDRSEPVMHGHTIGRRVIDLA